MLQIASSAVLAIHVTIYLLQITDRSCHYFTKYITSTPIAKWVAADNHIYLSWDSNGHSRNNNRWGYVICELLTTQITFWNRSITKWLKQGSVTSWKSLVLTELFFPNYNDVEEIVEQVHEINLFVQFLCKCTHITKKKLTYNRGLETFSFYDVENHQEKKYKR